MFHSHNTDPTLFRDDMLSETLEILASKHVDEPGVCSSADKDQYSLFVEELGMDGQSKAALEPIQEFWQ